MPAEMTDRDHFAAAALTGLLVAMRDESMCELCESAYGWADAMLRKRGSHIPDAGKMAEASQKTQDWLASTPQVPRKPRTPQSDRLAEWERHGSRHWGLGVASDLYDVECRVAVLEQGSAATPATDQERFNAAVMNWISEASTVLFHRMEQTTDCQEIISDACERCWVAYGQHSTNHDAAPAARAGDAGTGKQTAPPCVETDGLPPDSRTGPINRTPECESPRRECGESLRRDVTHPDTKGRAAGGPAHNTQEPPAWGVVARPARPAGAERRRAMSDILDRIRRVETTPLHGTEAWADLWGVLQDARAEIASLREAIRRLAEQDATLSVCNGNVTVTMDATLADAERKAVETARMLFLQGGEQFGHAADRERATTLDGLLDRLGGAK